VIDSSGLRLFYTSTLRQYDSGTLELGLPPHPNLIVWALQSSLHLSGAGNGNFLNYDIFKRRVSSVNDFEN
jgi:hypothetical protein